MRSETTANILVINCGSSSLKFRIISMPAEKDLASGEAVRVGTKTSAQSLINLDVAGNRRSVPADMPDHRAAFDAVIALLRKEAESDPALRFDCFAHRFVHPGPYFSKTARIDADALAKLKKTLSYAPIHNVISVNLIDACATKFSDVPQYAVFDTSFHRTIPPEFGSYALPAALVEKHHLRKVGFHGISHQYIMNESCRFLGRDPKTQKIISCHLGSGGSSVCAIRNGVSINNSMGFTPLEGLMMNTRCGDMDIGVLLHMLAENDFNADDAEKVLNYKSGVLGVFDSSSDMRDVAKRRAEDEKAQTAYNMYVRRVRRYIGYYALILQKADILVFTDTLGVEMPGLRHDICAGLECLGISLADEKNGSGAYQSADLTGPGSATKVLVIPTNEEITIAREAYEESSHDHSC
jgi:acetate kinase